MVVGLSQVKYSEGVCPGCEVGKHPEEKYDKGKSWKETTILELIHSDVLDHFLYHHLVRPAMFSHLLMTFQGTLGSFF